MQQDLLDYARTRLAAQHGLDHPRLEEWAQQAVELYRRSTSPEVEALVASFRPLSAAQERVLAALLTD